MIRNKNGKNKIIKMEKNKRILTDEEKADMRKHNSERYNKDLEYKEYQRKKSRIHACAVSELIKKYKKEFDKIKLKESKKLTLGRNS